LLQSVECMLRNGEWYQAQERADALRDALSQPERAALADQPQTKHWQGCEEVHPECAIAEVERLRRGKKAIADYVKEQYPDREALKTPTKSWGELEKKYQAGCDHCNHPQYCGIRCSVCGRWTQKK